MKLFRFILLFLLVIPGKLCVGHPNGNVIVTENQCVLWPYVYPVGDIGHHACVMVWDQDTEPRMFLKSEYESSDFFLYTESENIYILENRYLNDSDRFESRLLKTSIKLEAPRVIWDWFEDSKYIGVGGFKMISDTELLFVHYPNMYSKKKGKEPVHLTSFGSGINKMKPTENGYLLLWSDHKAWLSTDEGKVIQEWDNLIEDLEKETPMGRNFIFEMAYCEGELLLAYWGKRSFELIDRNGRRSSLYAPKPEWVPHWVSFMDGRPLLFSSFMDFENSFTADGKRSTIRPNFVMYEDKKIVEIWKMDSVD